MMTFNVDITRSQTPPERENQGRPPRKKRKPTDIGARTTVV